jgi:hypothetical protein
MSIVPAIYFSDHIRRAQCGIGDATDSISVAAVAQLRAAHAVLAADAECLPSGPVFQISTSVQPSFGFAADIELSARPSPQRASSGDDVVAMAATSQAGR